MFGKKLEILRNLKGLTRKELAEALGISPETLKGYEYGKREPNFEMLEKIANYFTVSFNFLFGREEIAEDEEMIIGLTAGLSPEEKKKVIELVKTAVKIYGTEDTKK